MATPFPFVASSVINANVVMPIIQATGATPIYTLSSDHFSIRYGASEVNFVVLASATLGLDINIGTSITVKVSIDRGANQTLTTGGGRPAAPGYVITGWPNDGQPHLVTVSITTVGGSYTDFYNVYADVTSGFSSQVYGTLPDGTPGYGTGICTVNSGATALQNWIDAGGGCWGFQKDVFIDFAQPSISTSTHSNAQSDACQRFYAKGSSVWFYINQGSNQLCTYVPCIDGNVYAGVTITTGLGGMFGWVCLVTSSACPAFDNTTMHEVIISICQYGSGWTAQIAGIMAGGTGAAIQTSALTPLPTFAAQGDSITQGSAYWNNSLFTNSGWVYKLGRLMGYNPANLGIGGIKGIDHYFPVAGLVGNGLGDQGSGVVSADYRNVHTGDNSAPTLTVTPVYFFMLVGTNDLLYIPTGQQMPLYNTDPASSSGVNVGSFIALGGNAGGTTITFTQLTYAFSASNQGQMLTGNVGANAGKQAFITGWSSGVLTIEPMGSPGQTWAQVGATDTFTVTGVAFYDHYIRECRAILDSSQFSTTKLVILNLCDRTGSLPVSSQGNGTTPSQITDYRTAIATAATALIALYGASRVKYFNLASVATVAGGDFFADGLHPNALGGTLIANAINSFLNPPTQFLFPYIMPAYQQEILGDF